MSRKASQLTTKTKMTRDAAARIQSSEAARNGGTVAKGGFAARAQAAAEQNAAPQQKK